MPQLQVNTLTGTKSNLFLLASVGFVGGQLRGLVGSACEYTTHGPNSSFPVEALGFGLWALGNARREVPKA